MMHASHFHNSPPLFIPISGAPQKAVGFHFRPRNYRVNRMKISSLDVDRITREVDFNALQENIMEVTFCNVDLDTEISQVDSTFTKLFKLAQLIIEYLLHSQEYLSETVARLDEKLRQAVQQCEDLNQGFNREHDTADHLKSEVKQKKKLLQLVLKNTNMVSKCPYCQKVFMNSQYLQLHLVRRHRDIFDDQTKEIFKNLESETNEVREKLKATEIQLEAERLLRVQQPSSFEQPQQIIVQQLADWRNEQLTDYRKEFDDMKNDLLDELKSLIIQTQEVPASVKKTRSKYTNKSHTSHLGFLEDDEPLGDDQNESKERIINDEKVNQLSNNLQQQLNSIAENFQHRLELQEKHWHESLKKKTLDQQTQLKQLQDALEKLRNQQNSRENQRVSPVQDKANIPPTFSVSEPTLTARPFQTSYVHDFTGEESSDESEPTDTEKKYESLKSSDELRQSRLISELQHNPTILRGLRSELSGVLDDKLYSWGISPYVEGISNVIFNNKLQALRSERDKLARKNKNLNNMHEMCCQQADAVVNKVQLIKAGTVSLSTVETGALPFLTRERLFSSEKINSSPNVHFSDQKKRYLNSIEKDSTVNYPSNNDDVDTSVSESSDEKLHQAPHIFRKTSSELSSNTYGTSAWGSSTSKEKGGSNIVDTEMRLEELMSIDGSDT